MLAGMPISFIVRSIATTASLSAAPGGRLKDKVAAVNWPWWLTASGALPGVKRLNAASGTMVEAAMLTAAPVAVPERVEFASWLEFWLRAAAATDGPGAAPTDAVVGEAS